MQDINNIRFSYASGRHRQVSCGPCGVAQLGSAAMSDTEPAISCRPGRLARTGARIARLIGAIEVALPVRRERRLLLGVDYRMLEGLGLKGSAYAVACPAL